MRPILVVHFCAFYAHLEVVGVAFCCRLCFLEGIHVVRVLTLYGICWLGVDCVLGGLSSIDDQETQFLFVWILCMLHI